ncbi:MAG: HEPN domain-containing protein [Thiobacillaceae bacterium]|nr:HEPN domain-containing protein [Thiobacillaceae bacterium]
MNRSQDWLAQARRDLDQARASQAAGRHEWARFAAQQAAAKAVKALHLALGQEGHVIARLLTELPLPVPAELLVYSAQEWQSLPRVQPHFATRMAREVVWVWPPQGGTGRMAASA